MELGRIAENTVLASATTQKPAVQEAAKKDNTLAADNTDKFVRNESAYTPSYTKASGNKKNVDNGVKVEYKNTLQTKNELMQSMVEKTIGGQSATASSATTIMDKVKQAYLNAEKTSEGTDDYWGAEATAGRILEFAKTLAGDDEKLFTTLKDAFKKGFGMAEGNFGGKSKLPSVCYDTYDKVMKGFDDWEKELKGNSNSTDKVEEDAE